MKKIKLIVVNGQGCTKGALGELVNMDDVLIMDTFVTDGEDEQVERLLKLVELHPDAAVMGFSLGCLVVLRVSNIVKLKKVALVALPPMPGQLLRFVVLVALMKYIMKIILQLPWTMQQKDAKRFFFNVSGVKSDLLAQYSPKWINRLMFNQCWGSRRKLYIPLEGTDVSVWHGNLDKMFTPRMVTKSLRVLRIAGIKVIQRRFAGDYDHLSFADGKGALSQVLAFVL